MLRVVSCSLAAAMCSLLAPAGAAASSVSVVSRDLCELEDACQFPTSWPSAEYIAAAGEANALELSFAEGVVSVRDAGAVIAPGAACSRVSEHEAACRPADVPTFTGVPRFRVQLGDGPDTLALTAPFPFSTSVTAEAGDDVVAGGDTVDNVDGGAGDDRIEGAGGDDGLNGGAGRDAIAGGAGDDEIYDTERDPGPDRYDGGDGRDLVGYAGRRAVTASLRDGTGPGGDELVGIEHLAGARGNDRLTGDGGGNVLFGHGGRDRLDGGAGGDILYGGPGTDRIAGGPGRDEIWAEGGDRVACGAGDDLIVSAWPADLIARDCEAINLDFLAGDGGRMRPNPVVRRGVARFVLPCPAKRGCRGSARLRAAGAATRRAFTTRRRGRISVRVPLPARAKLMRVAVRVVLRGELDEGFASYSVRVPR